MKHTNTFMWFVSRKICMSCMFVCSRPWAESFVLNTSILLLSIGFELVDGVAASSFVEFYPTLYAIHMSHNSNMCFWCTYAYVTYVVSIIYIWAEIRNMGNRKGTSWKFDVGKGAM